MMGNQALALGLLAAAELSGKKLFLGTYPITPASDILHELTKFKNFGTLTFQAEDEIAAVCSTIGAAFGGAMAVTTTSGPGIALKGEAMGLGRDAGVAVDRRSTCSEVGRVPGCRPRRNNPICFRRCSAATASVPMPVIAAASPADCFDVAREAWRIAVRFMTPVVILSDGYIANGSEPWRIPNVDDLPRIEIKHPGPIEDGEEFPALRT